MFAFGGAPDLSQQVTEKVGLVSKVVWPALATLVPAGVTAAFKWSQDHSRGKLRVQLTERVSALAKAIAELPPEAPAGLIAAATPHMALTAEMNEVLRELTALQTRAAQRRFTPGFSAASAISKVRAALLLYKPKGALAWMLHLAFFSYLIVLAFVLVAVTSSGSVSPTDNNAAPAIAANAKAGTGQTSGGQSAATTTPGSSDTFTNVVAFIFIFGIAGVPPMIIRFYAAKIHRKQLESLAGAAGKAAPARDVAGVAPVAM
jgi:hypothetical protein